MIVHSLAFFRHEASGYEQPQSGTSQGIFFSNFLSTLVRAHYHSFKGWELRIHHDERVKGYPYFEVLDRMHRSGMIRLVPMGEARTLCGSMLWRLMPIYDPAVHWVVCRDIDSLPMPRDRKMVEEAIAAGADFHAILDSESHSGPLMGGMTAFRAEALRKIWPTPDHLKLAMAARMPHEEWNRHGSDQRFLNGSLWPQIARQTVIHQRRTDIQYPEAMRTFPVAPSLQVLDQVVRHIGAGYDREKATKLIESHHCDERIFLMEKCEFPGARKDPWYAPGTQEFLESVIKPDWNVFEFGGGASTIWYSDRVKLVVTAEDDRMYRTLIEDHKRANVELVGYGHDPLEAFDLVAVDGHDRVECAKRSKSWVKPGGYFLLDNADEDRVKPILELMQGWPCMTFNHPEKPWQTNIWRRPE